MTPTMTRHALPDGANRYTRDADGAELGILKPMIGRAQGGERWHLSLSLSLWTNPPKVLWHSWEAAEYALLSAMIEMDAQATVQASTAPAAYRAVFTGQAWVFDHAIEVDDGRHEFTITQAEVDDAGGLSADSDIEADDLAAARGDWDALSQAANAPDEVRNWSGPFEITLHTLA